MRSETAVAIAAMSVLTVASQGVGEQLTTVVIAEKPTVRLGDPIKVSVCVTNQAAQEVQVDRSATAFDCFEVIDPVGQPVPYVGFDGQVMANPVRLPPSSSITIADALDLTEKFIIQKAGQYSIQFRGGGNSLPGHGATSLPGAQAITVDVAPGQLSKFDQLAVRLLAVCPNGWRLAKDRRGEVAPFGRSRVDGLALHVCHNHMRGEAVYLWFVDAEAGIDLEQPPRVKTEYLGRAGGLYVYVAVDSNAPPLWPTVIEDISRALQIAKK